MPKLPPVHRYVSNTGVRVYRIPLNVLPGLTGRVYLLLGAGPPTLVDAGSGQGDSMRQLLDGLDAVRARFGEPFDLSDLKRILITHAHRDHFGGLAELVATTAAEVAVHPLDRQAIEANRELSAERAAAFRRFLAAAGVEPHEQPRLEKMFLDTVASAADVPVAFTLDDGREFDGLRILHTPGHSPGHVCIAVGDVLLAGDHVLARTLTQQWPESVAPGLGLGHYLEALEKLRRAGAFSLTLGGHEPPIRDLPKRIDEIHAGHQRRLERMLALVRDAARPLSIAEISRKMYSHQEGFRAMLALTDVGARVEYLHQRGRLAAADLHPIAGQEPPVCRYEAA